MSDTAEHKPPLDYSDFREAGHTLAEARKRQVQAIINQVKIAARAEGAYQAKKTAAFVRIRGNTTATEAENTVKGQEEVREAMEKRDIERELIRVGYEELRSIDAERATLHRLAEWSMKRPQGEE